MEITFNIPLSKYERMKDQFTLGVEILLEGEGGDKLRVKVNAITERNDRIWVKAKVLNISESPEISLEE